MQPGWSRSDFEMAGNFSCFLVCGLRRYPHEYPAVDWLSLNIPSYYWTSNIEKRNDQAAEKDQAVMFISLGMLRKRRRRLSGMRVS